MPIQTVTTWTRPNKSVLFYKLTQTWIDYNNQTYNQTGLRLSAIKEISPDKLSLTMTSVWKDAEALAQFRADPVTQSELFQPRIAHNAANSITVVAEDAIEI